MKFYLVQDGKETKLPVYRCKKPLFKAANGRTWSCSDVLINGSKVFFHLDTSYGVNTFFEFENQWYKLKFDAPDYYIRFFEPTLTSICTHE